MIQENFSETNIDNVKYLNLNILITKDNNYNQEIPYYTIKKDEWELKIYYRNIGSKSEGSNGILLYKNVPMLNDKINNIVKTSIGEMKYYGEFPENVEYPWNPSGWNYANKNYILHSWNVKDKISFINI